MSGNDWGSREDPMQENKSLKKIKASGWELLDLCQSRVSMNLQRLGVWWSHPSIHYIIILFFFNFTYLSSCRVTCSNLVEIWQHLSYKEVVFGGPLKWPKRPKNGGFKPAWQQSYSFWGVTVWNVSRGSTHERHAHQFHVIKWNRLLRWYFKKN